MPQNNSIRLDDGFSTIITLANIPTVHIYEKEVTPPGISGGGAIDTTTMRNTKWRSMAPKALKTLTDMTAVVAFSTDAIPVIMSQTNIKQQITVTFPDGSSLSFYGWMDEFTLGKFSEGDQPTATIKIVPSNINPLTGLESAPDYVGTSGSHN